MLTEIQGGYGDLIPNRYGTENPQYTITEIRVEMRIENQFRNMNDILIPSPYPLDCHPYMERS